MLALDWLNLAASGITLLTAGPTLHSYISGFSLARKVDQAARKIETLDDRMVEVAGDIRKIAEGHFATNTLGVSLRGASTIDTDGRTRIAKPQGLAVDYVTECETEIDRAFRESFMDTPENFLHGICDLTDEVPDVAHLRDDTLVPWHFNAGDRHKIGFTKKGFLDHLGIDYVPLGAFDAESPIDAPNDDTLFPAVRESIYAAEAEPGVMRSLARIKAYRGNPDFSGIHEYVVQCPDCGAELDFPTGHHVERYLRLRCGACHTVFLGEVLRTNASLRFYRQWSGTR